MLKRLAWLLLPLGLGLGACIQLPIISGDGTSTSPPGAARTPTPNHDPIIRSLTAHRFVTASQSVTLWVQAFDPDCDDLKVSWSTTDGMLSSTVGTDVTLTAAATRSAAFITTVQVSVSDGRGGSAQGSLNVQIGTDGLPVMPLEATASQPTPEPCSTPTPEPTPGPTTTTPTPPAGNVTVSGRAYTPGGYWNGQGSPPEDAVAGATFVFDSGSRATAVTTDGSGRYSISLPRGSYSIWGEQVGRLAPAPYSYFYDEYPNHPQGYDKELFHYRATAAFQANSVVDVFFH